MCTETFAATPAVILRNKFRRNFWQFRSNFAQAADARAAYVSFASGEIRHA
jgi:biopolymer transport protein ExbB/TolQ